MPHGNASIKGETLAVLVRELRDEVARCADRDQLLVRARQWLYKNKLVVVHERATRSERFAHTNGIAYRAVFCKTGALVLLASTFAQVVQVRG